MREGFFCANHLSEGFNKEENNYFHNHIWRKSFPALTGHKNFFHPLSLVPPHLHCLPPMAKAWVLWETSAEAAATLRQVKKRRIFLQFWGILAGKSCCYCMKEHSQCYRLTLPTQKALDSTQWSHLPLFSELWYRKFLPYPKESWPERHWCCFTALCYLIKCPFVVFLCHPFSQGCIFHTAVPHWVGEFIWRLREAIAWQLQRCKGKAEMPLHSTCWGDLLLLS